jgi:hypothetical protein
VRPLQVDLGFGGYVGAKRFRFEVTRYFKGQLGPSLPVFTVDQESACGRDYALGESHVIYARYTDDGLLTDFACSPSAPSSAAAGALAVLGEGLAPDESYPEDLDTAPAAANDSEVESGIHRVPVVTDQPARSCASLASAGSSPLWPTLAASLGAIALAAVRRRPRR